MNWPALPFVRLMLPFGVGIYLGTYFLSVPVFLITLIFIILGISTALLFGRRGIYYRFKRAYAPALFSLLLCLGFLLSHLSTPWNHPQHIRRFSDNSNFVYLRLLECKNTGEKLRTTGRLIASADSAGQMVTVSGKLLLYLPYDSLSQNLKPGDRLLVKASPELIEPPKNPLAFDFAAYMSQQGVYHRCSVHEDQWQKIGNSTPFLMRQLGQARHYGLSMLSEHVSGSRELAIGAALIMGNRALLDEDTRDTYVDTGAIHVLAVSGLHVGIVFLVLNSLFHLLGWKARRRIWLKSLLLLLTIWVFAFYTGASASVLRASTMFSFVIIGAAFNRRHNIYNTLAASAFLLLCVQPRLLLDVGFQLSYLAVVGIVFFQQRIYRLWYVRNAVGKYIWSLTAVSIAAQLTTLPISLFYFHQFPLYFWLSGWVVVPAATIILVLGLLLLSFGQIGFIADALGKVLSTIIWCMNKLVDLIRELPPGTLTGVWLSAGMVALLYLTLLAFMSALDRRQLRPIRWALAGLLLVGSWRSSQLWQARCQQQLTIYHLYGHTVLDIFDGHSAYSLSDLPPDDPKLQMATENFRAYHHIRHLVSQSFQDSSYYHPNLLRSGNFLQMGDLRLAIIEHLPERAPPQPIMLDYVLLHHNARVNLDELNRYFKYELVIFDASNSRYRIDTWIKTCETIGQPYYNLAQEGAFTIRIQ